MRRRLYTACSRLDSLRFIFNVGILLAKACQPFGVQRVPQNGHSVTKADVYAVDARLKDSSVSLPDMIAESQTTKGRLLHYYPPPADVKQSEALDSWLGPVLFPTVNLIVHQVRHAFGPLCSDRPLLRYVPPGRQSA